MEKQCVGLMSDKKYKEYLELAENIKEFKNISLSDEIKIGRKALEELPSYSWKRIEDFMGHLYNNKSLLRQSGIAPENATKENLLFGVLDYFLTHPEFLPRPNLE